MTLFVHNLKPWLTPKCWSSTLENSKKHIFRYKKVILKNGKTTYYEVIFEVFVNYTDGPVIMHNPLQVLYLLLFRNTQYVFVFYIPLSQTMTMIIKNGHLFNIFLSYQPEKYFMNDLSKLYTRSP